MIERVEESNNSFLRYYTVGSTREEAAREVCKHLIKRLGASDYIEFKGLEKWRNEHMNDDPDLKWRKAPVNAPSWSINGCFKRTDEISDATDAVGVPQRTIKKNLDVSAVDENGELFDDEESYQNQDSPRYSISVSSHDFVPQKN